MNVAWLCVTKTLSVSASSLTQSSMPRTGTLLTFKPYAGHHMQVLIGGHSIEVLLQVATEICECQDLGVCRCCETRCPLCLDQQHKGSLLSMVTRH